MTQDILTTLGIKIADLTAGFCGGVVNAFVFKRSDPWSIIGSVIVGALTANYLGEPTAIKLGLGEGTAAFCVGLSGMAVCQGIIEAAKKWRPSTGESNGH